MTLVFPRREAEGHIVVMKKIPGRSLVMRILVLAMDLIASAMAMEDMVVVVVLILIISVVAVVHMDVVYNLKMKSLNTMIMKDLMMMKILLHMVEGLSDVIITDVLILKIGIIIVVVIIEMIRTTLLESN